MLLPKNSVQFEGIYYSNTNELEIMIKFYILYSENLYTFQNANKGGI